MSRAARSRSALGKLGQGCCFPRGGESSAQGAGLSKQILQSSPVTRTGLWSLPCASTDLPEHPRTCSHRADAAEQRG